jgi:hypothetical protein
VSETAGHLWNRTPPTNVADLAPTGVPLVDPCQRDRGITRRFLKTGRVPTEPDRAGSELELLQQYLDVQREALLAKAEGLDSEQRARRHPPSTLTLGGLIYHLSLPRRIGWRSTSRGS